MKSARGVGACDSHSRKNKHRNMKQQVRFEDVIGKTVTSAKFTNDGGLHLTFDDDTFCAVFSYVEDGEVILEDQRATSEKI